MATVKRVVVAVVLALVLLHLAGSILAAVAFLAFVVFFAAPAVLLLMRAPLIRELDPPLRLIAACIAFVLLLVPYFFTRKVIPYLDVFACIALTLLSRKAGEDSRAAAGEGLWPLLIAGSFASVWLGYEVAVANEVRYYGLFAIDFGNLVSVVSTLRASPMLPLTYVAGGGPLSYHWLYFTMPATLADFLGIGMPNGNALILTNYLIALLLYRVLAARTSRIAAAIVLFAPFSVYAYQQAAAKFELGWLELPARNHLLLSPINSMIVFGNNTFALVMALFAMAMLERWNERGRIADAAMASIALAAIAGFSITLVFPLALALAAWTLLGRMRRLHVLIPIAAITGIAVLATLLTLGILGGDTSRKIAVSFDGGAYFRMSVLGMLPLWLLLARRRLELAHVLIASCLVVPTFLSIAGSPTGHVDFSMKTASLMAVAFAPLIRPLPLRGRGTARDSAQGEGLFAITTLLVIAFGTLHSLAYVAQFPIYRFTENRGNGEAIPRDYHRALVWVREHTPGNAVIADPYAVPIETVLYTTFVGERRVAHPTKYTESMLVANASSTNVAADYLVTRDPAPGWRLVARRGGWFVYARRR